MAEDEKTLRDGDLIVASDDLLFLLRTVLADAAGDGMRQHMLAALRAELSMAQSDIAAEQRAIDPLAIWTPDPLQIWSSAMKRRDGKRLSAYAFYREHFEGLPRTQLPYAHQVRQNPLTKDFYNSLCVLVSRNRARGLTPSSIGQLFPISDDARGGLSCRREESSARD